MRFNLKNIKAKFLGFLKQGTSPRKLALSTTIGLLLGIFPMLGVTTFVMALVAVRFRLNLPLMLFVSYLIYPVQIFLIIPFVRLGEWLMGAQPIVLKQRQQIAERDINNGLQHAKSTIFLNYDLFF